MIYVPKLGVPPQCDPITNFPVKDPSDETNNGHQIRSLFFRLTLAGQPFHATAKNNLHFNSRPMAK